jgi:hypothetical protein
MLPPLLPRPNDGAAAVFIIGKLLLPSRLNATISSTTMSAAAVTTASERRCCCYFHYRYAVAAKELWTVTNEQGLNAAISSTTVSAAAVTTASLLLPSYLNAAISSTTVSAAAITTASKRRCCCCFHYRYAVAAVASERCHLEYYCVCCRR